MSAEEFVLDRTENPHPRMLAGALKRRAAALEAPAWPSLATAERCAEWRGFLAAMVDATGETPGGDRSVDGQARMMFRYLTGVCNVYARDLAVTHDVGLMLQPRSYRPARAEAYPVHAINNGCFSSKWEEGQWLRYLDRCDRSALFAVAPDVPFDWAASWAQSEPYIDLIRGMGFRVAVAMQNGATADTVPWDALDVVFLGGDTAWKLGTEALYITNAAHDRGIHVHMGRANSTKRCVRAVAMGCDTADGTFLRHGPPQLMAGRLRAMLDEVYRLDGHQLALA